MRNKSLFSSSLIIALIIFVSLAAYLALGIWAHGPGTKIQAPTSGRNYSADFFINVSYVNVTDIESPQAANTTCYISTDATNATWTELTGEANSTSYTIEYYSNRTSVKVNATSMTNRQNAVINCTIGNTTTFAFMNNTNMTTDIRIDDTPPNVTIVYPSSGLNFSQAYNSVLNANVTAKDDIMGVRTAGNIANGTVFFNVTNSSYGWNGTFTASEEGTSGNFNISINLTYFADGVYNITVYANDSQLGKLNDTQKSTRIYIDNTIPQVTSANITVPAAGSNYSGTLYFNVTAYDATSGIKKATFILRNTSNSLNSTIASVETSATPKSLSVAFNTSQYPDGNYTINVSVNDSAGNTNKSSALLSFTITIDNTAPSVGYTCDKSSVEQDATLTCSCSATDAQLQINTTDYTASPSTALTGSFTKSCSAMDQAGNTGTAIVSYTVTSSGSGTTGGGGGGGAGATPTTPAEIKKEQSWVKITPGVATIIKNFDKEYGIKEIQVEVSNEAQDVKISVTKYDSKPAEVTKSKEGKVYKYLQIKEENIGNKLQKAKIKIQVEKSWLENNNLEKDKIALFKFSDSEWKEIATNFVEEIEENYIYEAEVTSFSYFAIGEKVEEGEIIPKEAKSWLERNLWLVIVIIAIIAGIAAYILYKRKQ